MGVKNLIEAQSTHMDMRPFRQPTSRWLLDQCWAQAPWQGQRRRVTATTTGPACQQPSTQPWVSLLGERYSCRYANLIGRASIDAPAPIATSPAAAWQQPTAVQVSHDLYSAA